MKLKRIYMKLKRWYVADVNSDTDTLVRSLFLMNYTQDRLLMYGYDAYGCTCAWLNMKSSYDVNRLISMLDMSNVAPLGNKVYHNGVCYYTNKSIFV